MCVDEFIVFNLKGNDYRLNVRCCTAKASIPSNSLRSVGSARLWNGWRWNCASAGATRIPALPKAGGWSS